MNFEKINVLLVLQCAKYCYRAHRDKIQLSDDEYSKRQRDEFSAFSQVHTNTHTHTHTRTH